MSPENADKTGRRKVFMRAVKTRVRKRNWTGLRLFLGLEIEDKGRWVD